MTTIPPEAAARRRSSRAAVTEDYLDVPRQLIIDLAASGTPRDNHSALGLYLLVCRLYLVVQRPVLLSRQDLQAFDPALTDGAISRAFKRLTQGGWLLVETGYKYAYRPTWGVGLRTRTPAPWTIGQRLLGCPGGVARDAVRVERSLLDLFLGRLRPGAQAVVERYVTAPLLGLREVGGYIAARAGLPLPADVARSLQRWGLWENGRAARVPSTHTVLTLVSQRATPAGLALTEAGWQVLGWPDTGAPTVPDPDPATDPALICLVPRERIGSWVGSWVGALIPSSIAPIDDPTSPSDRSGCAKPPPPHPRPAATGIRQDSSDARESPPPRGQQRPHGKAAGGSPSPAAEVRPPDPETVQLLTALGCYPTSVADLASIPAATVQAVITYARAQPTLTDPAAWVVDALRKQRAGQWTLPQQTPASALPRWDCDDTRRLVDTSNGLFRLGSDTADLEGSSDTPSQVETTPLSLLPTPDPPASGEAVQSAPSLAPSPLPQPAAPAAEAAPSAAGSTAAADEASAYVRSRAVRQRLREGCDPALHPAISRLQIQIGADTTTVRCATAADGALVRGPLADALRMALAALALPEQVAVLVPEAAPAIRRPSAWRAG